MGQAGERAGGQRAELVAQLRADVALAAADTVLIAIPNQLGVAYSTRQLAAIRDIGDEIGWNDPPTARRGGLDATNRPAPRTGRVSARE
ncbi:hypothetical protein N8K70_03465 [Microbacterium betulae]|uniref:Uncharacterized protein n=1 Tax=Microbacterium betulae TaxID=2981139 RepID=A0AA97FK27_9MICO|nr:hypothetical protein [Microbacterium sp. AB]WOF23750.1 hypothetical protein N8K70_03465 [Microbacterium sp. AB]